MSAAAIVASILKLTTTVADVIAKGMDEGLDNEEIHKRLADPAHVGDDLLDAVRERHEELEGLLAEPEIINDQNQYRELSQEYSRIGPIVKLFTDFQTLQTDIVAAEEMLADSDPEAFDKAWEEARRKGLLG